MDPQEMARQAQERAHRSAEQARLQAERQHQAFLDRERQAMEDNRHRAAAAAGAGGSADDDAGDDPLAVRTGGDRVAGLVGAAVLVGVVVLALVGWSTLRDGADVVLTGDDTPVVTDSGSPGATPAPPPPPPAPPTTPPTEPPTAEPEPGLVLKDVTGMEVVEAVELLSREGLLVTCEPACKEAGREPVLGQSPDPGTSVEVASTVVLTWEPDHDRSTSPDPDPYGDDQADRTDASREGEVGAGDVEEKQ